MEGEKSVGEEEIQVDASVKSRREKSLQQIEKRGVVKGTPALGLTNGCPGFFLNQILSKRI